MLRILGSARTLCDGLTRRDLLHVGGLSLLGLGLGDYLRGREARAAAPGALPGSGWALRRSFIASAIRSSSADAGKIVWLRSQRNIPA